MSEVATRTTLFARQGEGSRGTSWNRILVMLGRKPFRIAIRSQVWLSDQFDRLMPAEVRVDGNAYFRDTFARARLSAGMTVADVGGGRSPFVDARTKRRLDLFVVGIDVDGGELACAPVGLYDQVQVADICTYRGEEFADLVIARSVLEHVRDAEAALAAIHGMLRFGGSAVLFLPSRYAVFAILNRVLPEGIKRALLHGIFPQAKSNQGFPARYSMSTVRHYRRMAKSIGFEVVQVELFYMSSYFKFAFPLYAAWRLWILWLRLISPEAAAETFCIELRKVHLSPDPYGHPS